MSTVNHVSESDTKRLYTGLRSVPLSVWEKTSPDTLKKDPRFKKILGDKKVEENAIGFRILGRVAHSCEFDAFHDAVVSGNLPATKLSSAEMNLIRGGYSLAQWVDHPYDTFCAYMRDGLGLK